MYYGKTANLRKKWNKYQNSCNTLYYTTPLLNTHFWMAKGAQLVNWIFNIAEPFFHVACGSSHTLDIVTYLFWTLLFLHRLNYNYHLKFKMGSRLFFLKGFLPPSKAPIVENSHDFQHSIHCKQCNLWPRSHQLSVWHICLLLCYSNLESEIRTELSSTNQTIQLF